MASNSCVLFLYILGIYVQLGNSVVTRPRCFECTGVASPRDCNKITECPVGHKCSVTQYVSENANVKYNLNCMAPDRCNLLSHKRSDGFTVCAECCDGDMCNIEGCGVTLPDRSQRGPLCYNCPQLEDPRACRTVNMCQYGHNCNVHTSFLYTTLLYTSGCTGTLACDPVNNATSTNHRKCPWCCRDDFCNDHC